MKLNIPFFPNTEDNTHCLQATLMSVLKIIYPKENFTYEQLDELCDKPKNKYTWPFAFLVNLKKRD